MIQLKKYTIPELVIIAMTASLNFAIFVTLEPVFLASGIPPFPIVIPVAMMYTLCRFLVDKFGTLTLSLLIFSILAMPTVIWGPVPGPYKIFIALIAGIPTDTVLSLTRKKHYLFRGVCYGINGLIMMPLMTFMAYFLFHTELSEKFLQGVFVVMIIIGGLVEAVGGILGALLYQKIKDKHIVKLLQAWKV